MLTYTVHHTYNKQQVLPVGGIKEKTIAARRAGVHCLVFPKGNRRDYDELPQYLKNGLEVHFAATYADVFAVAFSDHPGVETASNISTSNENDYHQQVATVSQ
jgi:ATP-dependent Lon protease